MTEIVLGLLKPKRLYENSFATISNNIISLELGASTIIRSSFVSNLPPITIDIKSLYNGELDNATQIKNQNLTLPNITNWNEISISVQDVTVLSSISSIGEDLFYLGNILIDNNSFKLNISGLTYYQSYISHKVFNNTNKFNVKCDWQVFYYLFQMFKELSGKKIGTLLWADSRDSLYFTNIDKSHYIIVNKNSSIINYKTKYWDQIVKYYSELPEKQSMPLLKKSIQDNGISTDVKHLLRPFGDSINFVDYENVDKFFSNEYCIYINKAKK